MRTDDWDRQRFAELLQEIRAQAQLSDLDLAELAGRSRSQVNRWRRGENQPDYEALRTLVAGLSRLRPEIRRLSLELLVTAGYDAPAELRSTSSEVAASDGTGPATAAQFPVIPDTKPDDFPDWLDWENEPIEVRAIWWLGEWWSIEERQAFAAMAVPLLNARRSVRQRAQDRGEGVRTINALGDG